MSFLNSRPSFQAVKGTSPPGCSTGIPDSTCWKLNSASFYHIFSSVCLTLVNSTTIQLVSEARLFASLQQTLAYFPFFQSTAKLCFQGSKAVRYGWWNTSLVHVSSLPWDPPLSPSVPLGYLEDFRASFSPWACWKGQYTILLDSRREVTASEGIVTSLDVSLEVFFFFFRFD